jgi:hypothetical protein
VRNRQPVTPCLGPQTSEAPPTSDLLLDEAVRALAAECEARLRLGGDFANARRRTDEESSGGLCCAAYEQSGKSEATPAAEEPIGGNATES